ncbi:MAG: hypothetical protein LAP38_23025 [Acidobacteriia bacterium]|nr:hypothetical protein [Terriglobia bacterium]
MSEPQQPSSFIDLEKRLRQHPLVAPRLNHARDMHAAEATIRECIYGEPVTIESWRRSSTYHQIKMAFRKIKPRSRPTRDELERMMKHLSFEINRFRIGASRWPAGDQPDQCRPGVPVDAMIRESCLLHFRLLLDFFYPRIDPAKSVFDDIFVTDYFLDSTRLSPTFQKLLETPQWLSEYRDMLDWRLAHLTMRRFEFEAPPHRFWNPAEQFGHIEKLITEFLNAIDDEMKSLFDPTRQG